MKTKSASTCSILGLLQPLPSTMLPTCSDVLLHHLYLTKLSSSNTTKWYTNSDISSTIRSIYKDASIPVTLSDAGIHKKIDILVAERQKLMKYKTPAKLADFQTRMKMLFVVTDEVPEIEKEFYMDQQTERLLHISCFVDLATTKTLQKKEHYSVDTLMPGYVNYFYNYGMLPAHTKRSFQNYRLLTIHSSKVKNALLFLHERKYFHSLVPESVRDKIKQICQTLT